MERGRDDKIGVLGGYFWIGDVWVAFLFLGWYNSGLGIFLFFY